MAEKALSTNFASSPTAFVRIPATPFDINRLRMLAAYKDGALARATIAGEA